MPKQKVSIKQHFLYGGLTRPVFKDIAPLLSKETNTTLNGVAIMTMLLGVLLCILSFFKVLGRNVLPAYCFLFATSLLLVVLRAVIRNPGTKSVYVLGLLQTVFLLVFGILNSAVFAPSADSNGTIFVVILLVTPFMFTDIPARMIPLLIISSLTYCILIRFFKAPSVITLDTVNTFFVFLVSCVCNWIFCERSFRDFANQLYIEKERDTDALTGLLTKQSARIITTSELSHGTKGVFVIIDLDNFKSINDTYGHLYGDEVLVKISNCIKQNTRRTDVTARFGGDEFTIFFPNMDVSMVEKKIADLFLSIKNSFADQKVQVTCSAGIQQVLQNDEYDDIFNAADTALYHSKKHGKNRFSIYNAGMSQKNGGEA